MTELSEEYGRPWGGYALIMAAYGGAVAAVTAPAVLMGKRPPERLGPLDLLLMGVSTHRLSRTPAKEPVAGYAAGLVLAPRLTRLFGATMTAVAVSDRLQLGYAKLMKEAE